jgi:hypothetical protein
MSDLTVRDWVMELRLNVGRLVDIVTEVEQLVVDGNLDSAALVLDSQGGKVGRFEESWRGLRAKLDEEGASTERALDG